MLKLFRPSLLHLTFEQGLPLFECDLFLLEFGFLGLELVYLHCHRLFKPLLSRVQHLLVSHFVLKELFNQSFLSFSKSHCSNR